MPDSIVMLSPFPWRGIWQSTHHMATEFQRLGRMVLYVELSPEWNPRSLNFDLRRLAGMLLPGLSTGKVQVLTPRALPGGRIGGVKRFNSHRHVSATRRAIETLEMRDPLVWVSYYAGCLEHVKALGLPHVYHCLDHFPYGDRAEEAELARTAIHTYCVSQALCEHHAAANPVLLPNGVNLDDFGREDHAPADLPPGPLIGYVGTLSRTRHDIGLLIEAADAYPNCNLVLVGPVLTGVSMPDAGQLGELRKRPNVHFLGAKPAHLLAGYIRWFDVCLMPFLDNEAIRCADSAKLYLYFAAGKPTVSTPIPSAETYRDACYVASRGDFARMISIALEERDDGMREARLAIAREHSWSDIARRAIESVRCPAQHRSSGPMKATK